MRTNKGDPRWQDRQVDVKPEDWNKRDNLTSAEYYRKSVAGGTIGTVTGKRPRLRQSGIVPTEELLLTICCTLAS